MSIAIPVVLAWLMLLALVAFMRQRSPAETRAEILRRLYPDHEVDISAMEQTLGARHRLRYDTVVRDLHNDRLITYRLTSAGGVAIRLTRDGRRAAAEPV